MSGFFYTRESSSFKSFSSDFKLLKSLDSFRDDSAFPISQNISPAKNIEVHLQHISRPSYRRQFIEGGKSGHRRAA